MRLLVDAGNTRMKWRLEREGVVIREGWSSLEMDAPFADIEGYLGAVSRVGVSTVAHEDMQLRLLSYLDGKVAGPVRFYWAEDRRFSLQNSYMDARTMGADRWHGMYGAWKHYGCGCAVIDAGSAITVDYVDHAGQHVGGYILPGLKMMLKSLKNDAARIAFEAGEVSRTEPGISTAECVNHGLSWLFEAMIDRVREDVAELGLPQTILTGGDAERLLALGMTAAHHPSLVLDGLGYIDNEVCEG